MARKFSISNNTHIELKPDQRKGLEKILEWLKEEWEEDETGIVEKSIETLNYILIREYYTTIEQDLLNTLRSQYVEDKFGKKK